VTSAAATLGEMFSSAPSTCSTKRNHRPLPLRGDWVALPARDLPPPSTLMRCLAAGACWACWWCSSACASRALAGGSARCGAPGASRWRLPSAAPGRPRGHCLAMPARYALGAWWVWFSPSSSALSHWPRFLTIRSRSVSLAHRSCSVLLLLLDASLVQLNVVML
jgi:hypothetical protein